MRLTPTLSQFNGLWIGCLIKRSLQSHFRAIYVQMDSALDPQKPTILFANHHYWWDGYLCYWLARCLGLSPLVWMEEWRRFPPFGSVGALPFPKENPSVRIRTLRETFRQLRERPTTLFLFPEGVLHPAPTLLPFKRALFRLAVHFPEAQIHPLAIYVHHSIHQYPSAYLQTGQAVECRCRGEKEFLDTARLRLSHLLSNLSKNVISDSESTVNFVKILRGKRSVHERSFATWGK